MSRARAPRRVASRLLVGTLLVVAAVGCDPDDLEPDDPVTDPREQEEQGAAGYLGEREAASRSR